jgi:hypothetical protein
MKRSAEIVLSTLAGISAGTAFFKWPTLTLLSDYRALGTTLSAVAATLLGFLIAALALLASVSQHWFVRNLQRTPHFTGILKDLYWSCAVFLLALVVGVFALLAPAPLANGGVMPRSPLHIVSCCLLAVTTTALLTLWPVGRKFWLILINLKPSGTRFEEAPADEGIL